MYKSCWQVFMPLPGQPEKTFLLATAARIFCRLQAGDFYCFPYRSPFAAAAAAVLLLLWQCECMNIYDATFGISGTHFQ